MRQVNKYVAIGHWKGSNNITSVVDKQYTKREFMNDLRGNAFVAYVVFNYALLDKIKFDAFDAVKNMTGNYRKWMDVTEYIEECWDLIEAKAARC